MLLFHRSNAADFTAGGESVGQSQVLVAEKRPKSEEGGTRIIKSTGSGTNAGKHSAPIAGLRCLHQESCLYQVLRGGSYFTGFATNSKQNVNEITISRIFRLFATHLRLRYVVLAYMEYRSS